MRKRGNLDFNEQLNQVGIRSHDSRLNKCSSAFLADSLTIVDTREECRPATLST